LSVCRGLLFDWNNGGLQDNSPATRVTTFGVYSGNHKTIYLREILMTNVWWGVPLLGCNLVRISGAQKTRYSSNASGILVRTTTKPTALKAGGCLVSIVGIHE